MQPSPVPLRAADLRFLLPAWPVRIAVLDLPGPVGASLQACGHELVDVRDQPDAVLCTPSSVVDAGRPPGG
ncbi:MAG: hypothetical protein JWO60_236, partial [Frankiales bacterium]|nr:hypothetical protein [Frankiales bacterium]